MRTQMAMEDNFVDLALNEELPSVVLCDRGLMDGQAYISEEIWQTVLEEMDVNHLQLRDKRYEAVLHMVTAADGAENFYNKGNEARYENIQQAIEVDRRLRNAYLGHHKFFIIDNKDTDFRGKIDKCVDIVAKIVGKPSPNSYNKKFLIHIANPEDHNSLNIPPEIKISSFDVIETLIRP